MEYREPSSPRLNMVSRPRLSSLPYFLSLGSSPPVPVSSEMDSDILPGLDQTSDILPGHDQTSDIFPGHDQTSDIFPGHDQTVTFPAGPRFQGHVRLSSSGQAGRRTPVSDGFMPVGKLLRPGCPTRQCSIPESDNCHMGSALMTTAVGSQESEVFRLRWHELVCAVSSQASYVDNEGRLVSSVDIQIYWCNFCTFSTANKSQLLQHVMEHRFYCKFCVYQSFCRADVVDHTKHIHPEFKGTAVTLNYCTLMPDYCRITHPKESELDHHPKRKRPSGDDGENRDGDLPVCKTLKTGHYVQEAKDMLPADCVAFDVDMEDKELTRAEKESSRQDTGIKSSIPALEDHRESASPSPLENSCTSSSSSMHSICSSLQCDPAPILSNQCLASQAFPSMSPTRQSSSESVLPPKLVPETLLLDDHSLQARCSSSSSLSCGSRSNTPSPPMLNCPVSPELPQLVCAYCSYSCASRKGIRIHCKRQHRGKPFKCLSPTKLDEPSAPPLLIYDDGKSLCVDTPEGCRGTGMSKKGSDIPMSVNVQESSENGPAQEPPVLVKQNVDVAKDSSPTLHVFAESAFDCKCFYKPCHHADLHSRTLSQPPGRGVCGADTKGCAVLTNSKSDCVFTSCSDHSPLSQSRQCIPRSSQNHADPLQNSVVECLQTATCATEQNVLSSSASTSGTSASKEKVKGFACVVCKNFCVPTKEEAKKHVIEYHASKYPCIRDMQAYRKGASSLLYFCRWCSWEVKNKNILSCHSVMCIYQRKQSSAPTAQGEEKDSSMVISCKPGDRNLEETACKATAEEAKGVLNSMPLVTSACVSSADTKGSNSATSSETLRNEIIAGDQCHDLVDTHSVQLPTNSVDDQQLFVVNHLEETLAAVVSGNHFSTTAECGATADGLKKSNNQLFDMIEKVQANAKRKERPTQDPLTVSVTVDVPVDMASTENFTSFPPVARSSACSIETSQIKPVLGSYSMTNVATVTPLPPISCFTKASMTSDIPLFSESSVKTVPTQDCLSLNSVGSDGDCHFVKVGIVETRSVLPTMTVKPDCAGDNALLEKALADAMNLDSETSFIPSPHVNSTDPVLLHSDLSVAANCDVTHTDAVCSAEEKDACSIPVTLGMDNAAEIPSCSSRSLSGIERTVNGTRPTGCGKEEPGSKDCFCEQGQEKNNPDVFAMPKAVALHNSLKHCEKAKAKNLNAEWKSGLHKHSKVKRKCAKSKTTSPSKVLFWCDSKSHEMKCTSCMFQSDSFLSVKTHNQTKHGHMTSPFKSIFHKNRHLKSYFFACPFSQCTAYSNDESDIVNHYRKFHGAAPHAYVDPSYVSAEVKVYKRNSRKHGPYNSKSSKSHLQTSPCVTSTTKVHPYNRPSKSHLPQTTSTTKVHPYNRPSKSHLPQTTSTTKMHSESLAEKACMCLYCDQHVYTDSVLEMKKHYLSEHTGLEIIFRDVLFHRERKPSRVFMCELPSCKFWSYEKSALDKHKEEGKHMEEGTYKEENMQEGMHKEEGDLCEDQSAAAPGPSIHYQCVACGQRIFEDADVQKHVSSMHRSERGARVVTLVNELEQQTVEERYITCVPQDIE